MRFENTEIYPLFKKPNLQVDSSSVKSSPRFQKQTTTWLSFKDTPVILTEKDNKTNCW